MNLYQFLCAFAALLILITAVARLQDIRKEKSARYWFRRVGLLMVFVSMTMFIAAFFTTTAPYWAQIQLILGLWGWLLTWMTTPGMPPWHEWIARFEGKSGD